MENLHAVIPGFFNLTLAGILLAWAYQRTGNLYFSIGLHMGWIFWVKAYAIVTALTPGADKWWWGSGRMAIVNGWVALPVLIGTLLVFMMENIEHRTSNIEHPMRTRSPGPTFDVRRSMFGVRCSQLK